MFYRQKALLSAQPPTFAVFKEQCAYLNHTKKQTKKQFKTALFIPRLKPGKLGMGFLALYRKFHGTRANDTRHYWIA